MTTPSLEREVGILQGQMTDVKQQQQNCLKTTLRIEHKVEDISDKLKTSFHERMDEMETNFNKQNIKIARLQWTLGPVGLIGTCLGVVISKYFHLG